MCTVQLFSQGVDLFALKFYLDRVVPHQPFWHQKTRDTGYPVVKIASLCVSRFDKILGCDGQTDRDLP